MHSIKLVYWNGKNLGDFLSPFIISNLCLSLIHI